MSKLFLRLQRTRNRSKTLRQLIPNRTGRKLCGQSFYMLQRIILPLLERYAIPAALFYKCLRIIKHLTIPLLGLFVLIPVAVVATLMLINHSSSRRDISPRTLVGVVLSGVSMLLFDVTSDTLPTGQLVLCVSNLLFYTVFLLWSLFSLGKSFGFLPAARPVIVIGPYGMVRHPIYSAYLLTLASLTIAFPCCRNALALVLLLTGLACRALEEECFLAKASTEYQCLKHNVKARFIHPILLFPLIAQGCLKLYGYW
jgi:protein-S-isoprenylcysteine O-methyltransferase Ste14